jgi:hypothetical protein
VGGRKPSRPWFKKKRFIIPSAVVLLLVIVGIQGGAGDAPATPAAAPTGEADVKADKKSDEAAAAEEAKRAEEERVAEEQRQAEEAAAEAAAAEAAAAEAARIGTVSQQNAYRSAVSYLDYGAFSRAGLLGQLTSEYGEGYPPEDAEFAVARLEAEGGVDWNAEAAEAAQQYLDYSGFSRQGLLDQLTSEYGEQFTPEQAEYGVSTTGL